MTMTPNMRIQMAPPHRRLRSIVAGIVAGSALFGCAGPGEQKQGLWEGGSAPLVRALPLAITGMQSASDYYVLGRQEYYNGRLDAAEAAYRQALMRDPNAVEALNGLAVLHDRLGRFDLSAEEYRAALQHAPEAPHILANLGYSLLLQGRVQEAVPLLRHALELAPDNAVTRTNLARAETAAASAIASTEDGQDTTPTPDADNAADTPDTPIPSVATTIAEAAAEAAAEPAVEPAAEPASEPVVTPASPLPAEPEVLPIAVPVVPSIRASLFAPVSRPDVEPVRHGIVLSIVGAASLTAPAAAQLSSGSPAALIASVQGAEVQPGRTLGEMFADMRVEVANGNGITGMARAMRARLNANGLNVTRVTNARSFDQPRTIIVCTAERRPQAAALAKELAVSPRFVTASTRHRNVELRLVLGADLVRHAASSPAGRHLAMLHD